MAGWESDAFSKHPGALHKQLGYPKGTIIPAGLINEIAKANIGTHVRNYKVTPLLKKRAVAANNARGR